MIIKVKRTAKDRALGPQHKTFSRREFIERGIFTTTMAAALPHMLMKDAFAAATCPTATAIPGGIAQIHMPGGGSASASYPLNLQQLNMATTGSSASNLWGITGGANLAQIFSNGGVDITSPFGQTLMTPPPGITAAAWKATLKQVSYGANYGAAPQDDGGGENLGHVGASSPDKKSVLNTDLLINGNGVAMANWATGLGAISKVNTKTTALTSASLATGFGITPSTGTNGTLFNNTATAANALGALFSSLLSSGRTGGDTSLTAASCGFLGDSQMASSTFGTNLFTPANIPAIVASGVTLGTMSAEELDFLAAYYQSNMGQLGGITSLNPGADYHNQNVQTTIAPYDQNIALQVRAWLLASMIANTPSAMIITTNGSPGPNGTVAATITGISGGTATQTVNGPSAQGDDGGSFSAHQSIPTLNSTGTFGTDGTTKVDSRIVSVPQSVGSLYFTALNYLGFSTTAFGGVLASKGITPVSLI